MYNQDYEEYMRNILGYMPNYQENTYRDANYYGAQNQTYYNNDKLESMYPEIYRTVYPLIIRELGMNNRAMTEDVVEEIVNKIHDEVENNRSIDTEKVETKTNNMASNNTKNIKNVEVKEDRQNRPRNNWLRDLIKILLLREIIGRPGFPPNRPPRPGGRPPFPGGPGSNYPPMPRDYYV